MKKRELQARIDKLERRVRELEARPIYAQPVVMPIAPWPGQLPSEYPPVVTCADQKVTLGPKLVYS